MMQFISDTYIGPLVGAEIGVFQAKNAVDILVNIPQVKHLYLVDPYKPFWVYNKEWLNGLSTAKEIAVKNLEKIYPGRYTWIYESFEADIIPEPLDFIYIDGCHSYEAVKHDIIEAEKIVKHGGIIGGHDYYPPDVNTERFGIGRAVREHYQKFENLETDWWTINKLK